MLATRRRRAVTRTSPAALAVAACASLAAAAAPADGTIEWVPWLVLGAVAVFVVGVALRMFIAARFPKGYRDWARNRRDAFEQRNEQWDRADEEFRK